MPAMNWRLPIRAGIMRIVLLWLAGLVALPAREPAADRPNLVFFLVDDMGWQDTSVPFHTGRTRFNDFYRTPNMERLARNGVRLTQAYACAVCTPTRVSWLTGQNAARHRVTNWTLQGETGRASEVFLPPDWKREGFQPGDAPTLPGLLRAAGYRTIHVGKAHWGAVGTKGADPLNLGFDVNIAGHAAGAPGSFQGRDRYGEGLPDKAVWAVPGLAEYKGTETHLTDALTREAARELDRAVREFQRPFLLHLSHYAVHTPIQPHHPYDAHYRDRPVAPSEINYASMIEGMDASLGAVLDKLAGLGVAARTLVVFYSDNGGLSESARGTNILGTARNTHNQPLREGKGSAYEGGIRVPALVAWAERDAAEPLQQRFPMPSGARCERPVLVEDWFPTLLEWARVPLPEGAVVDGESLARDLASPELAVRTRPLVWHFPNVWTPQPPGSRSGYRPHSTIRDGDWKAIYFYEEERWELFNLADDLSEARDLAPVERDRLAVLAARLRTRLTAVSAPWPVDKATGRPRIMKLPAATQAGGAGGG